MRRALWLLLALVAVAGTGTAQTTTAVASGGTARPGQLADSAAYDGSFPATWPAGLAVAWGDNLAGQLGDGTKASRSMPTSAGLTGVVALAGGRMHSLALRNDGTVWAWGENAYGQLGDGTDIDRLRPAPVGGLTDVVAIAAGEWHSLALRGDGTVWAWGINNAGELGDGTTTFRRTPGAVVGLTAVVAIVAGGGHNLALRADATLAAWGANTSGQLGDGTTTNRLTPVTVAALSGVSALAAGFQHSLALLRDGTVQAWGGNDHGQLGDGATVNRPTPAAVSGLTDIVALGAGWSHSLAVRRDGSVQAWGWNLHGQIGDGTFEDRLTPVAASGLANVVSVAAGNNHSLAMRSDGTAAAWGRNDDGRLGIGAVSPPHPTPVPIGGFVRGGGLAAGHDHTLGILLPPVIDPLPGNLLVGASNTLTGSGFAPSSVVKLFVATAGGAVAHGPYTPWAASETALTWDIPPEVPLGNGLGTVQVVNTDQAFIESNAVSALLEGNPASGVPTILFINGVGLGPADPGIGVAHIDTIVSPGASATIIGTGFADPLVTLFTAGGKLDLVPMVWTPTQVDVVVPVTAPTGPGNFQVVNRPSYRASNAVAAAIGAVPTVTSVTVSGLTVTVDGTGFSALSVINLFATVGGVVVNLGGLGPTGPRIPLTFISDTRLAFTRPSGVSAGPAFVEVLNPPFIPFSSSGDDPDGAFSFAGPGMTLVVDDDGQASLTRCDGAGLAFPTISAAIAYATGGETVRVCPGTYRENVTFAGKAITVESTDGPEATIIDGGRADTTVIFTRGEGRASRLRGFTVTNGKGRDGGGIRVAAASPTIAGNHITANESCSGCGVDIYFGSPLIDGNVISHNSMAGCSGGFGGGIHIGGASTAIIRNNVISYNVGYSGTGGISMNAAGAPTIISNLIVGNAGADVGGISMGNTSDALIAGNLIARNRGWVAGGIEWLVPLSARGPLLVNNTIVDNDGTVASGIVGDGYQSDVALVGNIIVARAGQSAVVCGRSYPHGTPTLRFNDVFAPSGAAYGGICSDQTGVNGNISADPLFVGGSVGDFHLTAASPAIDAGDTAAPGLPDTDLDGHPRILDGDADDTATVDMGADEFFDALSSVTLAQPLLSGCLSTTSTVRLRVRAPVGGLVVSLGSDNPHATVPASVVVTAGASAATFPIATTAVASTEAASITASLPGQTVSTTLTLRPMTPSRLKLLPNPVVGGSPVAGTVTLECAAGPGDIVVTLWSTKPAVASPAVSSTTVPAGLASASFEITTAAVTTVTKPSIKAKANGVTKSEALVVNPAP